ncbi:Uncharacterised protein [Mycobacteroides abscessus]|uniref:Uncharacterized protein n=4 Tax=Mycobacteroides abscessus TaxID=36809 RepID=A0AB74FAE8_9MYCO|nr:hypothetical protein [Mycobacteroides abscessus]AMU26584.1 hypothetical protein A3N96_15235 [Mycobacteroides abscessus]AMU36266.1 hypothetical protein A3N98_14425 [Mycobacteroides abscessus]AMU41312.1 hypothetical protein A3N99_15020 [Mycobacteroides abscessus]AMU61288.1 hypothetical protein A3O03_15140 [Mycobacteroides abscessus]MBN7344681.1 hypothetical protein [Mycobacteroides abscessus subsp. massiliense]
MPTMTLYTLWCEGYAATGEHGRARSLGTWAAESFDSAVELWNATKNRNSMYGNLVHHENGSWTLWGCRLFDNEADARRAFG